MPSNVDLAKEATGLAEQLGIEVETDGLNNADLVSLVSDLRAKAKDAENDTQADKQPAESGDEETQADSAAAAVKAREESKAKREEAAKQKPPFYMAPGKSLTSKKGILSGDSADEVKAEYLAGGKEALDAFVKSGHILKG